MVERQLREIIKATDKAFAPLEQSSREFFDDVESEINKLNREVGRLQAETQQLKESGPSQPKTKNPRTRKPTR